MGCPSRAIPGLRAHFPGFPRRDNPESASSANVAHRQFAPDVVNITTPTVQSSKTQFSDPLRRTGAKDGAASRPHTVPRRGETRPLSGARAREKHTGAATPPLKRPTRKVTGCQAPRYGISGRGNATRLPFGAPAVLKSPYPLDGAQGRDGMIRRGDWAFEVIRLYRVFNCELEGVLQSFLSSTKTTRCSRPVLESFLPRTVGAR